MNPLDQLRDIHLPPPVSWWPPAPGWWILALLAAFSCLMLGYRLRRRWQEQHYRREANAALIQLREGFDQHGDQQRYLHDLLALLRQAVKTAYPEKHWESLPASELIHNISSNKIFINHKDTVNYESILFKKHAAVDSSLIDQMETFIGGWIKNHRRGGKC